MQDEAISSDEDLVEGDFDEDHFVHGDRHGPVLGTATALLDAEFQEDFPKMVLEGAPGQGKSTLVQYVAQVHRCKLLYESTKQLELGLTPRLQFPMRARLPFKIDLRDLATWTTGKDPFAPTDGQSGSRTWDSSLEAPSLRRR